MKLNDAILGLVALLGGLAIIVEATTFPPTHGQTFGPDLFPTIVGAGLMLSGFVLIVSGWRSRQASGWIEISGITVGRMADAFLIVLSILAFILLSGILGFLITSGLTAWLLMVRFRRGRWLSSFATAAVTMIAVDWIFRSLLLVPLPQGEVLPQLPW